MGQKILIAEAHEVLRIGLHSIFAEDRNVTSVCDIEHEKDLPEQILHSKFDLAIINQELAIDMSLLQKTKFAIIAYEPDVAGLKAAYKYGACGYFSVNVSAELLRTLLRSTENSFLIEPSLTPPIMEHLVSSTHLPLEELLVLKREEIICRSHRGFNKLGVIRK